MKETKDSENDWKLPDHASEVLQSTNTEEGSPYEHDTQKFETFIASVFLQLWPTPECFPLKWNLFIYSTWESWNASFQAYIHQSVTRLLFLLSLLIKYI